MRKFGSKGDVVGSVEVRSARGFSRTKHIIAVRLPSGQTLQLSEDDAVTVSDALRAEVERIRRPT